MGQDFYLVGEFAPEPFVISSPFLLNKIILFLSHINLYQLFTPSNWSDLPDPKIGEMTQIGVEARVEAMEKSQEKIGEEIVGLRNEVDQRMTGME